MRWNGVIAGVAALAVAFAIACGGSDSRRYDEAPDSTYSPDMVQAPPGAETTSVDNPDRLDVWPQVWSQYSPAGASYEYKVNCNGNPSALAPCFLSDLDFVRVIGPDGLVADLEKDFNINDFSGEVTRRWVLYGPSEQSALPAAGDYAFQYIRDELVVGVQTVHYAPSQITYPVDVEWERVGADISVTWSPPQKVEKGMWYKAIIWNEAGTPELFVSQEFDWDASSVVMTDVPLVDGGEYSLNVAVFYDDGYAYSEYIQVVW